MTRWSTRASRAKSCARCRTRASRPDSRSRIASCSAYPARPPSKRHWPRIATTSWPRRSPSHGRSASRSRCSRSNARSMIRTGRSKSPGLRPTRGMLPGRSKAQQSEPFGRATSRASVCAGRLGRWSKNSHPVRNPMANFRSCAAFTMSAITIARR